MEPFWGCMFVHKIVIKHSLGIKEEIALIGYLQEKVKACIMKVYLIVEPFNYKYGKVLIG